MKISTVSVSDRGDATRCQKIRCAVTTSINARLALIAQSLAVP